MVFTRASQPMMTRSKGQARDDKIHLAELPKKRKANTRDAGSQINSKRVQTLDTAVQDARGGGLSKRASRWASMITETVQLINERKCSFNVKLSFERNCVLLSGLREGQVPNRNAAYAWTPWQTAKWLASLAAATLCARNASSNLSGNTPACCLYMLPFLMSDCLWPHQHQHRSAA